MDETNNLAPRERFNSNPTESLQQRSPFLALDLMPREPHLLDYLLDFAEAPMADCFLPARSRIDRDDRHLSHAADL